MRTLIVGAGALGGLVGAMLTRAGEDVTLLEINRARARLLNDAGLRITRSGQDEIHTALHVVTDVEGLPPFDLVFIAVKSYQTEAAVRAALPATGATTRFLSMQNGVGNAEVIASVVGADRTLCGITYHSVQHAGPGRLQFRAGIKPILIAPVGQMPAVVVEQIAAVFRQAGLETNVVENIDHALWQKLLHNAVVNPVSAVTGLTCREILGDDDLLAFMRDLAGEIIAVMRARGIPIVDEEDPFRPIMGSLRALGKNHPSMWQDLARRTRTEVDAINGAVAAEAARLCLNAPHNAALVRFIHSRERQTFLGKQEIARTLGLDGRREGRATVGAANAAEAPGDGTAAAPIPLARRTARDSEPLECTRWLHDLVRAYYRQLADDAGGRTVAACSTLAPVEVVRALGMVPYFPEEHAAMLSASGQAVSSIARAAAEGYSPFASSAMRADIGAFLDGRSPLAEVYGVPGPPRPALAVYSTNGGREVLRWFEFYGARLGVPVMGVHPPPALHELDQIDVDATVEQMLRLMDQLERASGHSVEMDELAHIVRLSQQATALWSEVLSLARAVPAPITAFDALAHLAPAVLLRGTPAAVSYYGALRDEVAHRVALGTAAVPDERCRLYWDGPPIWCAQPQLARLFAERGLAVVASTHGEVFTLPGLDADDPVGSLARTYAEVFANRSEGWKTAYLARRFGEFSVDGAIFHDARTSSDASHVRYGLATRVQRQTGVPSLVVEADAYDPRLFSSERLENLLTEFLERQPERHAALAM